MRKTEAGPEKSKAKNHPDRAPDATPETGIENETEQTAQTRNAGQSPDDTEPQPQLLLAQANDRMMRARAELENYRKRVQREFGEIRNQVKLMTIQEFLPVFDHFRMALEHAAESDDVQALRQGMDLIYAEFERTLANLGVETINAVGAEFNPTEHEAVAQEPSTKVPENCVIRQWKCGFRLNGQLLRPAAVVVSSGPSPGNNA